MPVTINGTTGVVTPGATIGSINGILKSSSGVVSQASVGTDYSQLTLATAQTASGTNVDFTGIPSWVKRINVMMDGVSTNGSSIVLLRLGTSGGITSSGYASSVNYGTLSGQFYASDVSGFPSGPSSSFASAATQRGSIVFSSISGNNWIASGLVFSAGSSAGVTSMLAGSVSLSSVLTQVRITTVNGTDTFDAGTINISYE